MYRVAKVALCCFLMIACQEKKAVIENFNTELWIKDSKGCNNERLKLFPAIEKQKGKLLNLSQEEIVEILGRPDRQELQKRNAKRFVYYVSSGKQCGTGDREGIALVIQFGALNYVSEVYKTQY